MGNILTKIQQIASNEGITIGAFERSIGASKGVLSRAIANGTDIQAKWLEKIVENYPHSAMAGAFTSDISFMEYECEHYIIPDFKGADFLIRVKGDSMQPTYYSGDLVACQKIPMNDVFFQWNKTYVLDTNQGAIIKRVLPGKDDDHICIVSDNTKYPPFELEKSYLHAIALVRGIIRLE